MGKIRTKIIGLDDVEEKQKKQAEVRRESKKLKKGKDEKEEVKPVDGAKIDVKETKGEEEAKEETPTKKEKKSTKKIVKKLRGKAYREAAKKVDSTKRYSLDQAVTLLKKLHYSAFDETVEIHCNLKEADVKGEVTLPHGTGKSVRVAVVSDAVLERIEAGKIDFDILISRPADMPRLVKFAKVLGPRGLMPSPKVGTVTDKPEEAEKKFSGGMIRFKSEAKFPLLHQAVGKMSLKEEAIGENVRTFIKAVNKAKINAVFLKSTMSPAIRLDIETL